MYMLEMGSSLRVEVDSAYHRTPGREVKNKIIARILLNMAIGKFQNLNLVGLSFGPLNGWCM